MPTASKTKRVRAEALIRQDKKSFRMRYPHEVREVLGGTHGDKVVFAQGNVHVAEQAALRGCYFVVWVEPGESPANEPPPATVHAESSTLEPLAEAMKKKLAEKGRR